MSTRKVLGKKSENLSDKKVLIVGIGGLGCTVANLLARVGIDLILIDFDIVSPSNIERQILYDKDDLSKKKIIVAKNKLEQFANIQIIDANITKSNISRLIPKDIDLVIDCTDNSKVRLIIDQYCKENNIDWIYSAAVKDVGAIYFIDNKNDGPCYRCIQQEKEGDTSCNVGVLNTLVVMVASLCANVAINYLAEKEIEKKLIRVNMNDNTVMKLSVKKNCIIHK